MAKEFAKAFYKSKAWRDCRNSYVNSVYGLCEMCGETGLILHHKITLTADNITDAKISLNHNNLQFLCLECHNKIHIKRKKSRFVFDGDGNIYPP